MSFEKDSTFARIIEEHLELKRKNTDLERAMPIDSYRVDDPFQNHPLFKTEEQARIEDTLSGVDPELDPEKVLAWPTDNGDSEPQDPEARAVALLRVAALREDCFGERLRARPDRRTGRVPLYHRPARRP